MTRDCEYVEKLREAKERSDAANADIRRIVREARAAGTTYTELGRALKMTPNGARLLLGRVENAEADRA